MTYADVAIPGVIGLALYLAPQFFLGRQADPDPARIRMLRRIGGVLLAVAALYLVVKLIK